MAASKSQHELERDWRSSILQRLDKLDEGYKEVGGMCQDIRLQLHKLVEIDGVKVELSDMKKQVRSLEDFKLKAVTILAVVQTILFIGWAILNKVFLK